MNKFVRSTFSSIQTEADCYREAVKDALLDFRRDMAKATAESKKFKSEAEYLASEKAAARKMAQDKIKAAEAVFVADLKRDVDSLRGDLCEHLGTRPNVALVNALHIYRDFDLQPGRMEVESLLELNNGNCLGIRLINKILEDTKSTIRVDAPAAADYEADFDRLERLTHGNFMYAPLDLHHEAVEVFGGLPRLQMRADGSVFNAGFRWDSTSIITAAHSFQEKLKTLDDMGERWAENTPVTLKHLSDYTDTTDPETGKTVTAAQQMAQDIKATATAPEIKRDGQAVVELARERAREQAERDARAAETVKKHTL